MYKYNPITGKMDLAGGGDLLIEKTYDELSAIISASGLVPGTMYKITDRGDRGLLFKAISTNQLSKSGTRIMLCPAWYGIGEHEGNYWQGIWHNQLTPVEGDLVIWGGLVWKNLTGAVGTWEEYTELDTTNWELVPKASFTAGEYVEMVFDVDYDFEHDWIDQQRDNRGNIIGIDYASNQNKTTYLFNPVDLTDWNFSARADSIIFSKNVCDGIFNNSKAWWIMNNNVSGLIANNTSSDIYFNTSGGNILNNSNDGEITSNKTSGSIDNNSNGGVIASNKTSGSIDNNSNGGVITNNNCIQIINNRNGGSIYNNVISNSIRGNYNDGSIYGNFKNGSISYNSNNGNIQYCTSDNEVMDHDNTETDVTIKDYDAAIGDIAAAIDLINGEVI